MDEFKCRRYTRKGSVGQTGRALQTLPGVNARTGCNEGGSRAVIGRATEAESEPLPVEFSLSWGSGYEAAVTCPWRAGFPAAYCTHTPGLCFPYSPTVLNLKDLKSMGQQRCSSRWL